MKLTRQFACRSPTFSALYDMSACVNPSGGSNTRSSSCGFVNYYKLNGCIYIFVHHKQMTIVLNEHRVHIPYLNHSFHIVVHCLSSCEAQSSWIVCVEAVVIMMWYSKNKILISYLTAVNVRFPPSNLDSKSAAMWSATPFPIRRYTTRVSWSEIACNSKGLFSCRGSVNAVLTICACPTSMLSFLMSLLSTSSAVLWDHLRAFEKSLRNFVLSNSGYILIITIT